MSRRSAAIYQRGRYWLGYEPTGNGTHRRNLAIHWYDRDKQRVRRTSTGTTDVDEAIAALDSHYLQETGQAHAFCPTCGRPHADSKTYLLLDAIADYRLEVGDTRISASSIAARLNHVIDYVEGSNQLALSCDQSGTETFARSFRAWSAEQPVVWRNKKGEITKSRPRTPAATEESLHQLRAVLNHAVSNERSDAPPKFKSLSRKRVSNPVTVRCDTHAIADMLAYAAESSRRSGLHAFLVASLTTIARPDAILDICTAPARKQWAPGATLINLNPAGRVQTKKHRPLIPVNATLEPWLQQTFDHPDCDWLINYCAKPVQSIRSAWRTMRGALNLPEEREWMPYILRRSLATELRAQHVDPWDLAGYMGHRVVGTTEIYTGGGLYSTVTEALNETLSKIEEMAPYALHPPNLSS